MKYFTFKIIPYTGNYSKNNELLQAKKSEFLHKLSIKMLFHLLSKISEYMHETVIKYPKVRKMSRKMNDIIKKIRIVV